MKQPKPKKNKSKPIVDLVIKDMKDRKALGLKRYKTYLQAFNNRNSVQDCYEEELDKILYMKQWLIEREVIIGVLKEYSKGYNNELAIKCLKALNEL